MAQASTPVDRQRLLVDAVAAQRSRDEELRVEAADHTVALGAGTVSFACTREQRDRLDAVLAHYPAFKLTSRLANDQGDTVTVSAKSDARNVAQFVEHVFRGVYGQDESYALTAPVGHD